MEMTPSATFQKIGDYAKMLDTAQDDPAVKKAELQVDAFQKECDRVDTLLKLPRDQRISQSGDLGQDIFQKYAQRQVMISLPIALTAWMGLGAAALIAAQVTAVITPGLQGILALGFLIGTFNKRGFPTLYAKAVKKWVLPKKVDKELVEKLEVKSKEAHKNLNTAQKSLEKLRKNNLKRALEEQKMAGESGPKVTEFDDEPDFVMIDDLKLARQRYLGREIPAKLAPEQE
jgi:hypothetical protein